MAGVVIYEEISILLGVVTGAGGVCRWHEIIVDVVIATNVYNDQ